MRTISDKQALTLKAATRRAIDMAGGGEAFSHATRIKAGNLSKYGSPNEDNAETFMPIDVAVECDIEAGSPTILSTMAEMLGYQLVPIAGARGDHGEQINIVDALNIANEAADVVRAITDGLADGHICAADRKEITREIDEALRAMKQALRKMEAH